MHGLRPHESEIRLAACGWVQVIDLMTSGRQDISLEDIEGVLPFELDRFQAQAIDILLQGSSVVVSAPTGAGKTIIAEAATLAVVAR